jgi:hypothetical protein
MLSVVFFIVVLNMIMLSVVAPRRWLELDVRVQTDGIDVFSMTLKKSR